MSKIGSEKIIPVSVAGSTLLRTGKVKVVAIRWVGATTAGHQCEIQDASDVTLWKSVAAGANHVELDGVVRSWDNGFKVPTLGSGVLYVELERAS